MSRRRDILRLHITDMIVKLLQLILLTHKFLNIVTEREIYINLSITILKHSLEVTILQGCQKIIIDLIFSCLYAGALFQEYFFVLT